MPLEDPSKDDIQQSLECLRANIKIREVEKRLSFRYRISDEQVAEILQSNAFKIGLESHCETNPFIGLKHKFSDLIVSEFNKGKAMRL